MVPNACIILFLRVLADLVGRGRIERNTRHRLTVLSRRIGSNAHSKRVRSWSIPDTPLANEDLDKWTVENSCCVS